VIYAIEDITERVYLEERLRQAQKMELVGQMTGGIAHDFNNLLAIIQGNAQLLIKESSDGQSKIETILKATASGAELTQRLLAFSRKQPLQPRPVDLDSLVSSMSEILARTLGETIKIEASTTPRLWPAMADPGQLENAVLNLALNARDAMPSGGLLKIKCVNCRIEDESEAAAIDVEVGDYVKLSVKDSGHGMTKEVQTHVFEPFFTTKEVGAGSGLGLSMIYGFIKQSGGHVSIRSQRGQGTVVELLLQRADSGRMPTQAAEQPKEQHGKGELVLLIEDDADVRSMTAAMLEYLHYQVVDVPNAAAAQAALARNPEFDMVVSDVILPGGTSGPEFVEQALKNIRLSRFYSYPDIRPRKPIDIPI